MKVFGKRLKELNPRADGLFGDVQEINSFLRCGTGTADRHHLEKIARNGTDILLVRNGTDIIWTKIVSGPS